MVRLWCWVFLLVPRPVGAGGSCLDILLFPVSYLFSFSLSLRDSLIWVEILSEEPYNPIQATN